MDQAHNQFLQAVKDGQLSKASALLANEKIDINKADQDGLTAIDHAAFFGHKQMIEFLLNSDAVTTKKSPTGITVMHAAALGGNVDIVKLLLTHGVYLHTTTVDGITPLHYASGDGRLKVVKVLLQNSASSSATTKHLHYTPLHKAACGGHTNVIEVLLEYKSPVDTKSAKNETSLHLTCQKGHLSAAKSLVAGGASLNALNNDKLTPRECAEENRHVNIVAWLDSIERKDQSKAMEVVCASEDCVAVIPEHLSFSEGDFITVTKKPYNDWWLGKVDNGKPGLFCTLLVDTRPLDILEGNLTNNMQQKHEQACKEVLQELHHTLACNGESRATAFMKYQSAPLLSERVKVLKTVSAIAKKKKHLYTALKNMLQQLDISVPNNTTSALDIVEAAVKFHKRQSDTIQRKLQQLEVDNKMDPVKIQQLKHSLRDKAQSLQDWQRLLSESYPCQVFTVRFVNKLSESMIALKAMSNALQANSNDKWDKSNVCITLLGKLVPLPGFTLFLGEEADLAEVDNTTKTTQLVHKITSLFSHLTTIDEVVIGTCLNLTKIYSNQINQLTVEGAAMLADGAVIHILDYLRFDCPDNQGTFITTEALSRATVFARRSMSTAKWLKNDANVPLQDPYDNPWNINGVFRLTGIRLVNGKKYRGHTTRSELYGYRNGSKIEATELCMVPAGEEHTIGPRLRKHPLKHSIKTATLYRRRLLESIEAPDRGSDQEFDDEDKQFKHMTTISTEVDDLKSPEP
ncbi:uncharacterized protein [Dysidea avara]|uniref:uncharacterized protein n=1 Tax=Dysidea avara TaxID=196820 RepID=UPI00331B8A9E